MTMDGELILGVRTYLEMDGPKRANFLNALSFIHKWLGQDSWVGFYLYDEKEDVLNLSLFQGTPACLKIKPERGVVGACFMKQKEIYVPDVRLFPGYIACDEKSLSEVVFYLKDKEGRIAIFDIDSPTIDGLKEKNADLREVSLLLQDYLSALD